MADLTPSRVTTWVTKHWMGLVPGPLRAAFFATPLARRLVFDHSLSRVRVKLGAIRAPLSILDGKTAKKLLRRRVVDAYLPKNLVLHREVEAPKSAKSSLRAVARLDLLRQTPFSEADIHWATSPAKRMSETWQMTQWIVRRSDLTDWRRMLADHGLVVRKVFVDGAETQGPLADFSREIAPRAPLWRGLNGALTLCAAAAVATIWLWPAWQAQQQAETLERQRASLRSEAVALRNEITQLSTVKGERAAFLDTIFRRDLVTDTLRALTVALPDEVWIEAMNFRTDRLVLAGHTTGSAADLVLKLENHRQLGNARLSGQTARTATGEERFELTIDLAGARR